MRSIILRFMRFLKLDLQITEFERKGKFIHKPDYQFVSIAFSPAVSNEGEIFSSETYVQHCHGIFIKESGFLVYVHFSIYLGCNV